MRDLCETCLLGVPSSKDISKVACRDREGDLLRLCAKKRSGRHLEVGVHIVDGLREDASPIDRIDCRQRMLITELGIVKQVFDDPLLNKKMPVIHRKNGV